MALPDRFHKARKGKKVTSVVTELRNTHLVHMKPRVHPQHSLNWAQWCTLSWKVEAKDQGGWVVVAHTINPITREAETGNFCEFEANLGYRASSRTDSKAKEKPCLQKPKQ